MTGDLVGLGTGDREVGDLLVGLRVVGLRVVGDLDVGDFEVGFEVGLLLVGVAVTV